MNQTCHSLQSAARGQRPSLPPFAMKSLAASCLLLFGSQSYAMPSQGVVVDGSAGISGNGAAMTIDQRSQNAIINWQGFSIAQGESVTFNQPNSQSVALNRVLGQDPSNIFGALNANGKVFLINPNGVLFGRGAQVNVGGLVASSLDIADADFMAGDYTFSGGGEGQVRNDGAINADGGYVALLGANVVNDGVISARLGSVVLAAGEAITLDVAGDGLLNVRVDRGLVNALVQNGGMIQADGGQVIMTTQAAGALLHTVVNNTGVIQARTLENRQGRILLLGDMQGGQLTVSGSLDASAPDGGNGGFIETSAATVNIRDGVQISTAAASGETGLWLIDPSDFTIGTSDGANISGATLSAQLVTNNITINTAGPGTGNGDIFVNDAVSWSASGAPTTLYLIADRNVEINAPVTATNGNFSVCCGQDVNVNAAITTTNGSVLLSAGRDINQFGAITVTDGNLMLCAAEDVVIHGAITLTRGTNDPTRSLGLKNGLVISADTDGTGPGIAGGTVIFDALAPPVTVTVAPVAIYYNPVSYTQPTDYSTKFTLTEGATLRSYMLVFADGGDKVFDGTTATTLTGLIGNPAGVSLVAGPGASANFDSSAEGTDLGITYTGYTLEGVNAGAYALAVNCCGTPAAHTTGTISAVVIVPPPVVLPPPPVVIVPPPPPPPPPPGVVPPVVVVPPGATVPVTDTPVSLLVTPGDTPPMMLVVTPAEEELEELPAQPLPVKQDRN